MASNVESSIYFTIHSLADNSQELSHTSDYLTKNATVLACPVPILKINRLKISDLLLKFLGLNGILAIDIKCQISTKYHVIFRRPPVMRDL